MLGAVSRARVGSVGFGPEGDDGGSQQKSTKVSRKKSNRVRHYFGSYGRNFLELLSIINSCERKEPSARSG